MITYGDIPLITRVVLCGIATYPPTLSFVRSFSSETAMCCFATVLSLTCMIPGVLPHLLSLLGPCLLLAHLGLLLLLGLAASGTSLMVARLLRC